MRFVRLLPVLVCLALGACAPKVLSPVEKAELLKTEVGGYVAAQDAGRLTEMYSYLCPGLKEKFSLEYFIRRSNMKFNDSKVVETTFSPDGNNATVVVSSNMSVMGYMFDNFKYRHDWRFVDGAWCNMLKLSKKNPLFP